MSADKFPLSDLRIGDDAAEDYKALPEQLGEVAKAIRDAVAEAKVADAEYRAWRAAAGKHFEETLAKPSEWRIRQEIERTKQFTDHKAKIAEAEADVEYLRVYARALEMKERALRYVLGV